jgi:hypothetical protein
MSATDRVVIQDLVVYAHTLPDYTSVGEGMPSDTLVNFIYQHVNGLISEAASCHRDNCCDDEGNIRQDRLNHITRLVTSEFYFYVCRALTLEEFEKLQQKIMNEASLQSSNSNSPGCG